MRLSLKNRSSECTALKELRSIAARSWTIKRSKRCSRIFSSEGCRKLRGNEYSVTNNSNLARGLRTVDVSFSRNAARVPSTTPLESSGDWSSASACIHNKQPRSEFIQEVGVSQLADRFGVWKCSFSFAVNSY